MVLFALRELVEHGVQLGRRIAVAADRDVVVQSARIERAERLVERAAGHASHEDDLAQAVLRDLTPVLVRQLDVGIRIDVGQAVRLLTDGDGAGIRPRGRKGACGQQATQSNEND